MRNKKTFMVIGLIVAVLVMGIAYAGISNVTLKINGTADVAVDAGNFNVAFSTTEGDTTTTKSVDSASVVANVTADDKATLSISGLTTIGQYVTATYTIKNNSDVLNANLTATTQYFSNDGTQDWFDVQYQFADTTIEAGESTTVTVRVELIKTPITEQDINDASSVIEVTVTAEPDQPTSSETV